MRGGAPLTLDNQAERGELTGPIADEAAFLCDATFLPLKFVLQDQC